MKKLFYIYFAILFLSCSEIAVGQQVDGYIPTTSDRDARQVSGVNVPPVFVYSSGTNTTSGTETPLSTCTPEMVTVKGPSGQDILTQTVCEKVLVATNPDKLFTVSGVCSSSAPSSMTATCAATNATPDWTNVSMIVEPLLDGQPIANWPSIFCFGCTWEWVQSSNSCASSVTTGSARQLTHNFSGNPGGTCASVGVFRVSDPETGKSWSSQEITARLTPTPIVRNHVFTTVISVGANDELYSDTSSQSMDSVASITFSPRLDGSPSSSWPNPPFYCPSCVYTHTVTSNTCSSVAVVGSSTVATHNVDVNGSCSFTLVMNVTDPDTTWSARLPSTGSYTVNLRKKPPTCIPANERNWDPRTEGCAAGYTGSVTYESEQSRDFVCATPYSTGTWTGWADTGARRNQVNGCLANCVPNAPEERWVGQASGCPTGQIGSISWESQERRTSSCPNVTGSPTWSGWSPTGATRNVNNSCTAACSPSPSQYQWVPTSGSCPAGQSGTFTWESEQRRDSSCATPTSSPSWSGWYNTGATRNVVNSCTPTEPLCIPHSPQTQWVSASGTCPAGQTGSISWEKEQSRTSYCPGPTGAAQWYEWGDTGNTRNSVSTCAAGADIIDSFVAGCFVDTNGQDLVSANNCNSFGGYRSDFDGPQIDFSVGNLQNSERYYSSVAYVTFSWSGDCTGTASTCRIAPPCNQINCPALGTKTATVTIRNTQTGRTRSFTVTAIDTTQHQGGGGGVIFF